MLLRHLRYLVAVVEHGGFTRAAEALHVSQPTLSQQVQQLEQRLGFNLLDRTGRIVRATDEGEAYLHHVRRAFAELKAAEQAVADVRGLGRGVLRIGVTPTFSSYFVGPVINAFGTRFPGIKTQLEVTTQDRLESELEIDRLDVGIAFEAVRSHEVMVMPLFKEQLCLVVAEEHALTSDTVPIERLSTGVPLALLNESFATRRHIDLYFREHDVRPTILFEGNSIDSIIAVVRRGRFATILPDSAAREQVGHRAIPLIPAIPLRPVGLLLRRDGYRSAAAQGFIETVTEVAARPGFSRT